MTIHSVGKDDAASELRLNLQLLRGNIPNAAKAGELLLRFKRDLRRELRKIEQSFAQDDLANVPFHAHRIRSGSLYLGIMSIGDAAKALESHLETHASRQDIQTSWQRLTEACRFFLDHDDRDLLARIRDKP